MATKDLFHNASLRLTSVYLLIIIFISLLFSVGLYRVSSQELEQSLRRPISQQEKRLFGMDRASEISEIIQDRENELEEAQNRLRERLILINIVIVVAGGGFSYLLARRTLKPIEEAHEAQSRFTADASHELRTPITAMRAETELTLTEPKLTLKDARKQLESNIEELDKLTSLSEGLLQLARLDNNGLEKDFVSVESIVQQAIDRVLKKAEQKKQIISTKDIDSTEIYVNQIAVVEALVTLLDNAVKYSPEKTEIVITKTMQLKSIALSVSDKGSGVKATELPHIFDHFYRADSSRTNSGEHGYGIGLSIAKSVAEVHGGSISAKSTPGKGSTFTLTLLTK
jgi:two-component system sensor histidine kinase CiaH